MLVAIETKRVKGEKKGFDQLYRCLFYRCPAFRCPLRDRRLYKMLYWRKSESTCIETTSTQPNICKRGDCISKVALTLTFLHVTICFCSFIFQKRSAVDLDKVTRSLKSFVDKVSSYEGAEFPG